MQTPLSTRPTPTRYRQPWNMTFAFHSQPKCPICDDALVPPSVHVIHSTLYCARCVYAAQIDFRAVTALSWHPQMVRWWAYQAGISAWIGDQYRTGSAIELAIGDCLVPETYLVDYRDEQHAAWSPCRVELYDGHGNPYRMDVTCPLYPGRGCPHAEPPDDAPARPHPVRG